MFDSGTFLGRFDVTDREQRASRLAESVRTAQTQASLIPLAIRSRPLGPVNRNSGSEASGARQR